MLCCYIIFHSILYSRGESPFQSFINLSKKLSLDEVLFSIVDSAAELSSNTQCRLYEMSVIDRQSTDGLEHLRHA